MTTIETRVSSALAASGVEKGSSLLIGVSGGPDSTALLRALSCLRPVLDIRLHACIIDHGIRSRVEISGDIQFVRDLCESLGIPLTVAEVPAGRCRDRARDESLSLEEVAREERHALLKDAAGRSSASWIALGHTQDDLLETVLMRFVQGSDVQGLAGIRETRGPFIRPLLGCTRPEIIDYLRSIGQGWREDVSNEDLSILRNRIRHSLVPVLDREFAGARSGILRLARKAGLVAELLKELGRGMRWTPSGSGFSIPQQAFLAAPAALRAAELMRLYDRLRGRSSPRRLPWRFIAPALEAMVFPASTRILLGHGVQLVTRGGRLHWERCIVRHGKKSYLIEVSETGSFSVPATGVRVKLARCSGKRSSVAGETALLARDIEPPLVLRSRRRGDEILLEHGAASLKELFAGWKVSEGQRNGVPILADRKGVVAVLGAALGGPSRIRQSALATGDDNVDCIVVRTEGGHGRGS
ncbi:MAG TPA: tRNA lysidine(34) synthetase TilS [Spirochaetia bacterium]|nr:tRNA lysidine(34) synthetase TilS [Spirochaetia bacterium]